VTSPAGSYTPSLLSIEYSFDSIFNNTQFINGGASGASGNALVYNAPFISANAKVGSGALWLNSFQSQYVGIPAMTTGSTGLSFACWFKSIQNTDWARIMDLGNGAASDNIIMAIYQGNLALTVFIGGNAGTQPLNVIPNVNDGVWRHVVWTLDPAGVWTVYLNGVQVWQKTSGYTYPGSVLRSSNYLGKSNWADPYYNGELDEFRMYGRVLTAGDVQTLYAGDESFATAYGDAGSNSCPSGKSDVKVFVSSIYDFCLFTL
jgi:hypothetical protein